MSYNTWRASFSVWTGSMLGARAAAKISVLESEEELPVSPFSNSSAFAVSRLLKFHGKVAIGAFVVRIKFDLFPECADRIGVIVDSRVGLPQVVPAFFEIRVLIDGALQQIDSAAIILAL